MIGKGSSPRGEQRSSALWGTGNRGGESRSNALWGKGGRGLVTALCAVLVVAAPLAAGAPKDDESTYVDPVLLAKANSTPNALVNVIIQSTGPKSAVNEAFDAFHDVQERSGTAPAEHLRGRYSFIGSGAATIKARKVLALAHVSNLT